MIKKTALKIVDVITKNFLADEQVVVDQKNEASDLNYEAIISLIEIAGISCVFMFDDGFIVTCQGENSRRAFGSCVGRHAVEVFEYEMAVCVMALLRGEGVPYSGYLFTSHRRITLRMSCVKMPGSEFVLTVTPYCPMLFSISAREWR